jgi:hypothetical protein
VNTPIDIDQEIPRRGRNGGWGVLLVLVGALALGSGATLGWAWSADRFVFWLVLAATIVVACILAGIIAPWRREL